MARARKSPPTLPGAQAARHEARRIAWTPEAKQISDRTGVTGSRSTSIVPATSGNRTHRDPIEERGVPCGETVDGKHGRELFGSHKPVHETTTDSCTGKGGNDGNLRDFLCRRVTDSVINTTTSE